MTWTGQTFSVGQILTATQMNNLQADITAHANGDTGAPQQQTAGIANSAVTNAKIANSAVTGAKIASATVAQGNIASSAVGQGQLKTTTGTVSATSSSLTDVTLPGGQYGFYPQIYSAGNAGIEAQIARDVTTSSYITNIALRDTAAAYTAMYAKQRYFQASPPYDLGDGEIPLFIFAIVDNATGNIEATYAAPEAPWHYNGPTDIRAQVYRGGKPYRFRRDMSAVPFTWAQAKGDPVKEAEYAAAFAATPIIEEEITQDIKNKDMHLIPHPFLGNDLTGKTVVMLDPVADITHQLFTMHSEYDDFDLASLLTETNAFQIDNIPLSRKGPPGVIAVPYKWRNAA